LGVGLVVVCLFARLLVDADLVLDVLHVALLVGRAVGLSGRPVVRKGLDRIGAAGETDEVGDRVLADRQLGTSTVIAYAPLVTVAVPPASAEMVPSIAPASVVGSIWVTAAASTCPSAPNSRVTSSVLLVCRHVQAERTRACFASFSGSTAPCAESANDACLTSTAKIIPRTCTRRTQPLTVNVLVE
jgi:hypothetical protein